MITLATALWPGLAAALLLGLLVGAATGLPRAASAIAAAVALLAALAMLAGLVVTQRVAGDAGLWLEAAALMLATYLAGCLLGALARLITATSR